MHARWYSITVVLLWMVTMGWLVVEKVAPALLQGDPPTRAKIIAKDLNSPPVGWKMSLKAQRLGWALSETKPQATGLNEIRGRVHFTMPLQDLMPGWAQPFFSRLLEKPPAHLRIEARSVLTIDPLGRLVRFDSTVQLDPLNQTIGLRGTVEEGRKLQLIVRTGNKTIQYPKEIQLPSDALLTDVLSPQTRLPG
jgi:hypothetical protein